MDLSKLKVCAAEIRYMMIANMLPGKKYHIGGALSCVDILVYLYLYYINTNNRSIINDKVILSKGHSCYALYAVLAYIGRVKHEEFVNFGELECCLQGHPDMKRSSAIDFSSGSLGQGLSVGVGMALGFKYIDRKENVFVIVGDGELQEGQNWEAIMSAAKYKLDNLYCIIDNNKLQVDGAVDEIMPIQNEGNIFALFGWEVEYVNGHDFFDIDQKFKKIEKMSEKPKVLILDTIKGKGVSFMENDYKWHSKIISIEDIENALDEINLYNKESYRK